MLQDYGEIIALGCGSALGAGSGGFGFGLGGGLSPGISSGLRTVGLVLELFDFRRFVAGISSVHRGQVLSNEQYVVLENSREFLILP